MHFEAKEGKGEKKDFKLQGIQSPTSILIKQICHKSFYKCPVGGYRGQWKYPIHALSSPAGLKPRLLARLSVLTTSDPLAICRVGRPALRALCARDFRFKGKTAGQSKGKSSSFTLGSSPFARYTSQRKKLGNGNCCERFCLGCVTLCSPQQLPGVFMTQTSLG